MYQRERASGGGEATSTVGARNATCLRGELLTGLCAVPAAARPTRCLAFGVELTLRGVLGCLAARRAEERAGDTGDGGTPLARPFPLRGEGAAVGGTFSEALWRDEEAGGCVGRGGCGTALTTWLPTWSSPGRRLLAGWSWSLITIGLLFDPLGSPTTTPRIV